MKHVFQYFATLTAWVVLAGHVSAATWTPDPSHTNVGFVARHMLITPVRGNFTSFTGSINYDEKTSTLMAMEASIDATSVNTQNEMRDKDLRSANFFDVANNPKIAFKSSKVDKLGDGHWSVAGDLTIKGITKPVVLDVQGLDQTITDPRGNTRAAAIATTTVNRHDFGLNWNKALETGGLIVGDSIKIEVDAELIKQTTQP